MANLDIARNARWQNVANFVLGAWLFISPWVLGFSDAGKVATNAWIFGIIIALLALSAIFAYQRWEEWLTAAIGVWVFIGVGRGIERAHPVGLARRRSIAGDFGALVVLARARIRSDRNATLTREPKVRAE